LIQQMVSSHTLVEARVVGAELNLGKYCTASLMIKRLGTPTAAVGAGPLLSSGVRAGPGAGKVTPLQRH
jgi:hypothetical protein